MGISIDDISFHYVGLVRRVIAFAFDFLIICGYILILVAVGIGLYSMTDAISLLASPLALDGFAFFVLVLPVILYFALQEGSSHQATWGKRRAKIKVVNAQGTRLSPWQALLRSTVKFLPWQLAHTCVIHIWFGNGSPIFLAGALAAEGLVGVYALSLWISKKHQTPYDLVAGAFVIFAD